MTPGIVNSVGYQYKEVLKMGNTFGQYCLATASGWSTFYAFDALDPTCSLCISPSKAAICFLGAGMEVLLCSKLKF